KIFGLFLVSIFSFRFIFDILRQKQYFFEFMVDLSIAQILSIPFILLGLLLTFKIRR
ncbi:prolipoprotein diacylglyceryl transferase, partial [Vibrio sp. V36_P2S2PM302]|nr:prolipoprotein diacylglyceryl transferase [Vibrio sp. V36_P2S2PM302]